MNQARNVLQFTIWYQITEKGKNMEDRYLYRAKRSDNGEWVEGNILLDIEKNKPFETYRIYPIDYVDICRIVDKTTICQCTGLKDKNGKLIWENDIVGYWDTYSAESGLAEADCIGQVVWDDETMSFQVTNRLSAESYEVLDECSVIGNIFDNPELLESEE